MKLRASSRVSAFRITPPVRMFATIGWAMITAMSSAGDGHAPGAARLCDMDRAMPAIATPANSARTGYAGISQRAK